MSGILNVTGLPVFERPPWYDDEDERNDCVTFYVKDGARIEIQSDSSKAGEWIRSDMTGEDYLYALSEGEGV
jgi:hypothetical protein